MESWELRIEIRRHNESRSLASLGMTERGLGMTGRGNGMRGRGNGHLEGHGRTQHAHDEEAAAGASRARETRRRRRTVVGQGEAFGTVAVHGARRADAVGAQNRSEARDRRCEPVGRESDWPEERELRAARLVRMRREDKARDGRRRADGPRAPDARASGASSCRRSAREAESRARRVRRDRASKSLPGGCRRSPAIPDAASTSRARRCRRRERARASRAATRARDPPRDTEAPAAARAGSCRCRAPSREARARTRPVGSRPPLREASRARRSTGCPSARATPRSRAPARAAQVEEARETTPLPSARRRSANPEGQRRRARRASRRRCRLLPVSPIFPRKQ